MKTFSRPLLLVLGLGLSAFYAVAEPVAGNRSEASADRAPEGVTTPEGAVSIMKRVADWQLEHPKHRFRSWFNAPLLSGLLELYRVSGDGKYLDALYDIGERIDWSMNRRKRHADDQAVGQTYLELYEMKEDPRLLEPIRTAFDEIMADPKPGREEWWWADALYMAPPTLARLAAVTGERKYLEFMDDLWWDATEHLYDPEEKLFYRDERFFTQKEANEEKVFWTRGNGWVLAGTVRVLQYMPKDYPSRDKYIDLFRTMAERIAELQREDGFWRVSMLDPASFPGGESSGTAFMVYAMAWGINQGVLDRETYEPVVMKGWKALCSAVNGEGRLGWVQQVGSSPEPATADSWQVYGSGAFLLAGSEVARLPRSGE